MDPDDGNHEPNRKGCRCEVGSEGSGRQTPGPRYTKRITRRRVPGHSFLGEKAIRFKAR